MAVPKRRRRRRKNNSAVVVVILMVFLVCVVCFAGYKYFSAQRAKELEIQRQAQLEEQLRLENERNQQLLAQETFYNGIYIGDVAVGGMTRQQAEEALTLAVGDGQQHSLTVSYNGQSFPIALTPGNNLDQLLDQAYQLGRTGDEEARLAEIKMLESQPKRFELEKGYSVPELDAAVSEIAGKIDQEPVNATVSGFDADKKSFTFTSSSDGVALDQQDLKAQIRAALEAGNYSATLSAKVTAVPAQVGKDTLSSQFVKLASFTTKTTSNSNRNTNIKLCSNSISGQIVQPGEVFSINDLTGERTPAKGYKEANVIKNGVYVEEPGGGVCQVSTTLFNAAIRAGLDITERHNHSIISNYIDVGEDAAIDYPGKDFKFTNNSDGPVAVVMSFDQENKKLTATIYGIRILEEDVTLELDSEVTETIPMPDPVFEEDPTLGYGEQVLVSDGREGTKVTTYLITKKDGKEVDRVVLHKSNYPKKAAVYKVNSSALPSVDIPVEGGGGSDGFDVPNENFAIPEE